MLFELFYTLFGATSRLLDVDEIAQTTVTIFAHVPRIVAFFHRIEREQDVFVEFLVDFAIGFEDFEPFSAVSDTRAPNGDARFEPFWDARCIHGVVCSQEPFFSDFVAIEWRRYDESSDFGHGHVLLQ